MTWSSPPSRHVVLEGCRLFFSLTSLELSVTVQLSKAKVMAGGCLGFLVGLQALAFLAACWLGGFLAVFLAACSLGCAGVVALFLRALATLAIKVAIVLP